MVKVLVLGSGGREHAIAHSLSRSSLVDTLYWTPGNAATEEVAENPRIQLDDMDGLATFARNEAIGLTIVGPEIPLVAGISDFFHENGLTVFGPSADGARIEGSKSFAKKIMRDKGIPTASSKEFTDKISALKALSEEEPPYVLKADGLAAGKGVIIARSLKEAENALTDMFDNKVFGASGLKVVVEDFLEGEEATVLALCDGKNIVPLISSQDHKPVHDGDRGPNTGGMGAIAPAPVVSPRILDRTFDTILIPLVEAFTEQNIDYRGIIYAGLMIKEEYPSVVEFNCRFGDPEAEAVLPLLESDLGEALLCTAKGDLENLTLSWKKGYACDVVLVSGGYPGKYEKEQLITGLDRARGVENLIVFHAGTKKSGKEVLTDGGRVLNVVGMGSSLKDAIDYTYSHVDKFFFDGVFYRTDIGFRGMKYFEKP
jgi:phosphoribosylamine--glycine ligase